MDPGTPRNGNPLRATFPAPRQNLKSVCKFSAATACITTSPFRIKIYNLYTSSPPPPHIHTYVIEYKFYRPLIIVYSITAATVDKLCGIFLYDALYGKSVTYDIQQTNTAHQIPLTVQSNSNLNLSYCLFKLLLTPSTFLHHLEFLILIGIWITVVSIKQYIIHTSSLISYCDAWCVV